MKMVLFVALTLHILYQPRDLDASQGGNPLKNDTNTPYPHIDVREQNQISVVTDRTETHGLKASEGGNPLKSNTNTPSPRLDVCDQNEISVVTDKTKQHGLEASQGGNPLKSNTNTPSPLDAPNQNEISVVTDKTETKPTTHNQRHKEAPPRRLTPLQQNVINWLEGKSEPHFIPRNSVPTSIGPTASVVPQVLNQQQPSSAEVRWLKVLVDERDPIENQRQQDSSSANAVVIGEEEEELPSLGYATDGLPPRAYDLPLASERVRVPPTRLARLRRWFGECRFRCWLCWGRCTGRY